MKNIINSILIVLLLASCANNQNTDEKGNLIIPKASSPSFVILAQTCPLANVDSEGEEIFSVLLGAIATAAVSAGTEYLVDEVSQYLKNRANEFNSSSHASFNGHLYSIIQNGQILDVPILAGCLIFYRAEQSALAVNDPQIKSGDVRSINEAVDQTREKLRELKNKESVAYLTKMPELYAEFLIQVENLPIIMNDDNGEKRIAGNTSIRFGLRPVYLNFNKSGAERGKSDSKDLIFDTHIQMFAKSGEMSTIHQDRFVFSDIKAGGKPLHYVVDDKPGPLFSKRAKLLKLPLPESSIEEPEEKGAKDQQEGDAEDKVTAKNQLWWLVPVTASISVTETQPGAGDLERRFAEKLAAKKGEISKAAVSLTDEQLKRVFGQK